MSTSFTMGERDFFYQLNQRLERYKETGSLAMDGETGEEATQKAIALLIEALSVTADRLQNPESYR
jgi:hypothetical protein